MLLLQKNIKPHSADNLPYEKVGKNEPVCIADEVPFEIPESWEWVTLKMIAITKLGKTLDKTKNQGDYKPYLCSINVYWNGIDLTTVKEARFEENEISKYELKKGDLLICEGGDVGRSAIWENDQEMYYQNALHRVRFYGGINPYYFRLLMECYKGNKILSKKSKGMTIKHLVQSALNAIYFPLPPIQEQQRIVNKFQSLIPILEQYNTSEIKLSNLNISFPDLLKKSILQEAVQGKLVPQDPTDEPAAVLLERIRAEKQKLIAEGKIKKDKNESVIFRRDNSHYEKRGSKEACIDEKLPFDIPSNWTWCRLRSLLIQASTGPFGSMLHKEDYTLSGVPLVNPANITDGRIISTKLKYVSPTTGQRLKSYSLHPGDVIIGRRGEMGRSAVVLSNQSEWLCGTGCFFVTPCSILNPEYLVFLLGSPYVRSVLIAESVGTTMNNLNHNILGDILIPLPPFNEQTQIMRKYAEVIAPLGV